MNNEFPKYEELAAKGASPEDLCELAQQDGLDRIAVLRMLRCVFHFSLKDAKATTFAVREAKDVIPPELREIEEPFINFTISQLTKEFRTSHPIDFKDKKSQEAICNIAKRHNIYQREYWRLKGEMGDERWRPASQEPYASYESNRSPILVYSPALHYVMFNGICEGTYEPTIPGIIGQYYLVVNGQKIPHKITHWRWMPDPPSESRPQYEDVKTEVEKLKDLLDEASLGKWKP